MTITSKIRPAAAFAACAAAAVAGLLAATPAQAQTTTPLVPVAGNAAVATHGTIGANTAGITPDILCDIIISRGNTIDLCSTGTYFDGGNPYRWPVTHLDADAANRVWFHFGDGRSPHCYSGGHSYNIPPALQDPVNIFISTNTAPC